MTPSVAPADAQFLSLRNKSREPDVDQNAMLSQLAVQLYKSAPASQRRD
jgi:hypothetical protein